MKFHTCAIFERLMLMHKVAHPLFHSGHVFGSKYYVRNMKKIKKLSVLHTVRENPLGITLINMVLEEGRVGHGQWGVV